MNNQPRVANFPPYPICHSIPHCIKAVIATALLLAVTCVQAESLVSVTTTQIPSLPGTDTVSRLLVVDGRPLALGQLFTWVLDQSEAHWQAKPWHPRGYVVGVAKNGVRVILLLSDVADGLATRVEELSLVSGNPVSTPLPPLPVRLASAQGALLQNQLFVAGTTLDGDSRFLAIDLHKDQPGWVSYQGWTAASGPVSSVVAQNSVLLVTVTNKAGTGETLLKWAADTGWTEQTALAGRIMKGAARPIGQGHVLYLVAVNHNGNTKIEMASFQTITGSWAVHGQLKTPATGPGVGWKRGILWLEQGKAGLPDKFALTEVNSEKQLLAPLDWGVISVYLLGMLAIGLFFYQHDAQDSKADFFLGGRSIPFWAAGVSLYVSNASSISYIAVPAKAFETNWQYLLSNLIVVLGLMFVAIWVVPMLRRLNLMSTFNYLETRFHPSIRMLSSALFIIFQLGGRMTVILFLPALAISTVTGVDVAWSILIMGGITIIYTVMGGMKAVIWTDFMQIFVMFGGIFFAIAFIVMMLNGGVGEFLGTALADHKMKLINWSFNLTQPTIWGFIFLVLFDTVLTFPKDQVLMQRILSTASAKEAGRSVWTFALIVLPASVLFYSIGTALYVFYKVHPERMDPTLTIDATFPLFIAAELPVGITGLIIAGIFAASMSTLSSILNSVATLTTVDFYEKLIKKSNKKTGIYFAEIVTVIAGLIGIGLALLLSHNEIHSMLDLALELWGLLGGGFAGAYTLGMFTRRSNWQGVVIGVAVSIGVTIAAWLTNMVHPYFYLPLSVLICIVVGYAASWLFPPPDTLNGLTVYKKDVLTSSTLR